MIKGFVLFNGGKIPFVISDYRMDLFTDDDLLHKFTKKYNFKTNYTLQGQYFRNGITGQPATFLVEYSLGASCFLRGYVINKQTSDGTYDAIGIQSPFLDDIFRYKYEYLDMVRAGINLALAPKDVYELPFSMNNLQYELVFRVGHNNHLGLLEDFARNGEFHLTLHTKNIQECYDIATVLHRLTMFMTSHAEVQFKRISLYKNNTNVGWFYCPYVSEEAISVYSGFFHDLDVMKYIPKILNNVALDSGNRITQSIPLGHIRNFDSISSPQRFVEQIMAFEYLFDKLEPKKAQDSSFPLKKELEYMFNQFPQLLATTNFTAEEVSEKIKETRRTIAHGYAYYYDFNGDSLSQYQMVLLDRLIRDMSLLWCGFTKDEIDAYPIC